MIKFFDSQAYYIYFQFTEVQVTYLISWEAVRITASTFLIIRSDRITPMHLHNPCINNDRRNSIHSTDATLANFTTRLVLRLKESEVRYGCYKAYTLRSVVQCPAALQITYHELTTVVKSRWTSEMSCFLFYWNEFLYRKRFVECNAMRDTCKISLSLLCQMLFLNFFYHCYIICYSCRCHLHCYGGKIVTEIGRPIAEVFFLSKDGN